jgi:hypothetical protein
VSGATDQGPNRQKQRFSSRFVSWEDEAGRLLDPARSPIDNLHRPERNHEMRLFRSWQSVPHPGPWNIPMQFTVLRSIVDACVSGAKSPFRRADGAVRRNREVSMGLEPLEQRMALTVAAPSIRLALASDTGIRGDWTTSVMRPVFTGTAPARSSVVVYADGNLLGVARATAQGAWSLATPVAMTLASGAHEITASAYNRAQVWSTVTKRSMTVDPAPTASLAYDSLNGILTLTFSEPVSGVRASNLRLSGRTQSGYTITNVSITDPRAPQFGGSITMSPSLDGRTFTFEQQRRLAEPGNFTLSFVKTGVVDRAGNPLAAGAATKPFTII